MNRKAIWLIPIIMSLLASCTSTGENIQPSIEEPGSSASQSAATPSQTEEPLPSPTVISTETPTSTPAPTRDPRVINTEPRLIILTEEEIDAYFDYGMYGSVPNYAEYGNITNPYANLACAMGYDGAADFLEETGLVTGWTTQYIRANINPNQPTTLPSHYEFSVLVFQTVEGPEAFMEEWDTPCEFSFYEYVTDLPLGEKATFCQYEAWMANGMLSHIRYRIAVRIQNIYLSVQVTEPPDGQLDMGNVFFVTDLQLQKIAGLPFEESLTLGQDFIPGTGCSVPPTPVVSHKPANSTVAIPMGWCLYDPVTYACRSKCMEGRPPQFSGTEETTAVIPCILTTKIDIMNPGEPPLWGE